jgi:predicted RecA/RadA family phage recombinase
MSQTFKQEGRVLTLAAPYNRNSGEGAKVGAIFGVAVKDVDISDDGQFMTEGVHSLVKATGAVTQGDRLYWDDSAKKLTTDSTAGMLVGVATASALSGDANAMCKLNEACPEMVEGAETVVALTDNSGGASADGTIGLVTIPTLAWNGSTDPTAQQATDINAALTALKDAVKELATKQNAVIVALQTNGALK